MDSFRCRCLRGFTGRRCESSVDACSNSPCQHGAACRYLSACTCDDVVEVCASDDEDCQRSECLRRGPDCQVRRRSFTCDCAGTGFTGDVCNEDVDECADDGCRNGGLCTNTAGSFECDCSQTGFSGSRCHLDIDECTTAENSRSLCHNNGQSTNIDIHRVSFTASSARLAHKLNK